MRLPPVRFIVFYSDFCKWEFKIITVSIIPALVGGKNITFSIIPAPGGSKNDTFSIIPAPGGIGPNPQNRFMSVSNCLSIVLRMSYDCLTIVLRNPPRRDQIEANPRNPPKSDQIKANPLILPKSELLGCLPACLPACLPCCVAGWLAWRLLGAGKTCKVNEQTRSHVGFYSREGVYLYVNIACCVFVVYASMGCNV
jgi:hypothetical protein